MPIEITDEFAEPTGEWTNYSSIVIAQEEALRTQKHVNIRSFVDEQLGAEITMMIMDQFTMQSLDGTELGGLTNDTVPPSRLAVVNNEGWTFGTVGPQSDRNNWNGISVVCDPAISSVTTTQSVITQNG